MLFPPLYLSLIHPQTLKQQSVFPLDVYKRIRKKIKFRFVKLNACIYVCIYTYKFIWMYTCTYTHIYTSVFFEKFYIFLLQYDCSVGPLPSSFPKISLDHHLGPSFSSRVEFSFPYVYVSWLITHFLFCFDFQWIYIPIFFINK